METTQRPAIPLSPTSGSCSRSPSPASGGRGGVGTDPLEVSNSVMVHSVHSKITCSGQQLGLPPSQPGYLVQFQFQVLHVVFPSHLVASILLIPVCKVSPMCLYQFQVELCNQLDGGAVKYALTGLQGGFCINFEASSVSLRSASSNMRSALDQPSVINAYPQTEFSSSQIVGPFSAPPFSVLQVSWFGVISKEQSTRKMALNLGFPIPLRATV